MTYEYECTECGCHFERQESMKAAPNPECPNCKRPKAIRKITGGCGFIMRGMPSRKGLGDGYKPSYR